MATVDVYFFQYSKKPASTSTPLLSAGVKLDCIFRDGYDVLNPTLELDLRGNPNYNSPITWNYMYIPSLSRYYWITDWAFGSGMWVCGTKEDLLGSHKTAIGNTTIFAQRLADRKKSNVVTDGCITDTMVPTLATPSWSRSRATSTVFKQSLANGTYVIGVINNDGTTAGSVAYYALTASQFTGFRKCLMGDGWISSTAEMSTDTVKAILNPIQYVTSCQWFPFDYTSIYDGGNLYIGMKLGWWQMTPPAGENAINYYHIASTGMYRFYINATVPVHPQYSTTNQKMLRCAPFSTYLLHLPYFGSIPIDYEDFSSGTVGCFFEVDIISGRGSVQLYNGSISGVSGFPDLRLIYQTSCQIATPIQLSQVVSDTWAAQVTELQTAANVQALQGSKSQQIINVIGEVGAEAAKGAALGAGAGTVVPGAGTIAGTVVGAAVGIGTGVASAVVNTKRLDVSQSAAEAAGLYASFQAAAPRVTSQGANGSLLGSWCPVEISGRFLLLSDTSSTLYSRIGYTAGWTTQINEHTGYVQGIATDFNSSSALRIEMDAIKAQIEAGIYYE